MKNQSLCSALLLVSIFLSACATRLEYASPSSVDISGSWVLNSELSEEVIIKRARPQSTNSGGRDQNQGRKGRGAGRPAGKPEKSDRDAGGSRPGKPDSMIAKEMTIEQNTDSVGIQYLDGLYRDVDWGKNQYRGKTVVAGWQGEKLLIKTTGQKMSFSEIYQLGESKDVLYVTHEIGGQSFVRVYERKGE